MSERQRQRARERERAREGERERERKKEREGGWGGERAREREGERDRDRDRQTGKAIGLSHRDYERGALGGDGKENENAPLQKKNWVPVFAHSLIRTMKQMTKIAVRKTKKNQKKSAPVLAYLLIRPMIQMTKMTATATPQKASVFVMFSSGFRVLVK